MGNRYSNNMGFFHCPIDLPKTQKGLAALGQDVLLTLVRKLEQIDTEDDKQRHKEVLRIKYTRKEMESGLGHEHGTTVVYRLDRPYAYDDIEIAIDKQALARKPKGRHARFIGRRIWVHEPRKELYTVLHYLEDAEMNTEASPTPKVKLQPNKVERAAGLVAAFLDFYETPTPKNPWLTKTSG